MLLFKWEIHRRHSSRHLSGGERGGCLLNICIYRRLEFDKSSIRASGKDAHGQGDYVAVVTRLCSSRRNLKWMILCRLTWKMVLTTSVLSRRPHHDRVRTGYVVCDNTIFSKELVGDKYGSQHICTLHTYFTQWLREDPAHRSHRRQE